MTEKKKLSFAEKIGLLVGVLGLAGVGLPIIFPGVTSVGWAFLFFALTGAAWLTWHHFHHLLLQRQGPKHKSMLWQHGLAWTGGWVAAIAFLTYQVSIRHGQNTPVLTESDAVTVAADCFVAARPLTIPPSGRIVTLDLWPEIEESVDGNGLGYASGQPGSKTGPKTGYVWRCELSNEGKATLYNVSANLLVTFLQPITDSPASNDKSYHSGKVIAQKYWKITAPKIEANPQAPFAFYIFNLSNDFMTVELPDVGTADAQDTPGRVKVRIAHPTSLSVIFPPPDIENAR